MLPPKSIVLEPLLLEDQRVFEKLFHEFFPGMYHFTITFVHDTEIAKDIVHEAFIKLWETKHNLAPGSNLEAYLITICRNKCLNFLKHKKIMMQYQESKNSEIQEIDLLSGILTQNTINHIDYELLRYKADSAIKNLPVQCRHVFELSRFKKKKYSEIAIDLNISIKTVEAHISLALKKLREELKEFL